MTSKNSWGVRMCIKSLRNTTKLLENISPFHMIYKQALAAHRYLMKESVKRILNLVPLCADEAQACLRYTIWKGLIYIKNV